VRRHDAEHVNLAGLVIHVNLGDLLGVDVGAGGRDRDSRDIDD
jgi:hypothetical protein